MRKLSITLLITMIGASLLGCSESTSKLIEITIESEADTNNSISYWEIKWKIESIDNGTNKTRGPYYIANYPFESDSTLLVGTYDTGDKITFTYEAVYITAEDANCNSDVFLLGTKLHILVDEEETETSLETPFIFTVP